MKNRLEIPIYKFVKSTANTREAVNAIFSEYNLNHTNEIALDFSEVEFVSRSFADSLIKLIIDLKETNDIKVEINNASDSVLTMLLSVQKTQKKFDRKTTDVNFYKYSNEELLNKYFFSI